MVVVVVHLSIIKLYPQMKSPKTNKGGQEHVLFVQTAGTLCEAEFDYGDFNVGMWDSCDLLCLSPGKHIFGHRAMLTPTLGKLSSSDP